MLLSLAALACALAAGCSAAEPSKAPPPLTVVPTAILNTTNNGCKCLATGQNNSWFWKGKAFEGCANPDSDVNGSWCLVDEATCKSSPGRKLSVSGLAWDYCEKSPTQTVAGCACRRGWGLGGKTMGDSCATVAGQDKAWCEVDLATCQGTPAGQDSVRSWDWCAGPAATAPAVPSADPAAPPAATTLAGCACVPSTYMGTGYPAQCSNPSGDLGGSWCFIDVRSCKNQPYSKADELGPWDYCKPAPDTTRQGCRCLNKWSAFPGSRVIPGTCEDVDGDGPWCVVDRASCTAGEPAGTLGHSKEAWDWCGPASAATQPVATSAPEHAGGAAEKQTTAAGCQCLPTGWTMHGQEYAGCQNPDQDPSGPWCLVDSKSCKYIPFGVTTSGHFYDYCTAPATTDAGCQCSPKWWLPPQDPTYSVSGVCVNVDEEKAPWCVVSESTCTFGTPAGRLATRVPDRGAANDTVLGSAWDYCPS